MTVFIVFPLVWTICCFLLACRNSVPPWPEKTSPIMLFTAPRNRLRARVVKPAVGSLYCTSFYFFLKREKSEEESSSKLKKEQLGTASCNRISIDFDCQSR